MDILTKITVTIAIITLAFYFGCLGALQAKDKKWANITTKGLVVGLAGLILCSIAHVWVS